MMARLPDFEAWAIFARVAETGSFSRAAQELALSKPTVSKAVARLERRLGAALFNRTSRRLSLTELGRNVASGAARMIAEAVATEAEASAEARIPRGLVRLAVPMSFGLDHVAPILPEFLLAHPEMRVDLHLSDRQVDLVGDGFDLALRIAELADSSLVARRLCRIPLMLVGSPAYFAARGKPEHPSELARHACLGYAHTLPAPSWRFTSSAGLEMAFAPTGPLRANNGEAMLPALLAGLGIAVLPAFMVCAQLADHRLETAMPAWTPPSIALHVVTPPGGPRPVRVTALIDYLAARLSSMSWARPD